MSKSRQPQPLSQLVDSTLRLAHYLPLRMRQSLYWWLFRRPFPHARSPEQLAILQSARPFIVPSGPYLLKGYRYPGPGPTVVLVHGWQGSAASWFRLVPLLIEAQFSVITFDAPGHSGGPRVATLSGYAQGVADVVELFAPVHALVGHSFGGIAAARAARDLPNLKALVTLGTPDTVRNMADGFARRMSMRPDSLEAFRRRLETYSSIPIDEEATSLYLGQVCCPVLTLHDVHDEVIPVSEARAIAQAGGSRLELTSGLGHRGIIRDPQTMAQVVSFLLQAKPCQP